MYQIHPVFLQESKGSLSALRSERSGLSFLLHEGLQGNNKRLLASTQVMLQILVFHKRWKQWFPLYFSCLREINTGMNCFSRWEKCYQQEEAGVTTLSFSVEGCCTLTVKLRSRACALQGQSTSEDSNGKNCLFTFLFHQKIFVFMVGLGSYQHLLTEALKHTMWGCSV